MKDAIYANDEHETSKMDETFVHVGIEFFETEIIYQYCLRTEESWN